MRGGCNPLPPRSYAPAKGSKVSDVDCGDAEQPYTDESVGVFYLDLRRNNIFPALDHRGRVNYIVNIINNVRLTNTWV